jgi:hypothetical protein
MLVATAVVIAVTIGAGARAQAAALKACALLTADDVAAVLGDKVTWSSAEASGSDDASCSYATKVIGDDAAELKVAGGRAEFDETVRQLQDISKQYHVAPLTPLSGVGDSAFLNTSGDDTAQVYVMKGGTYFYITVACKRAKCASLGSALAHKVIDRIK